MKNTILITAIASAFFWISCKKETVPVFTDTPVVESYLLPGTVMKVKISRQLAFSSDASYSSENIDSLSLSVRVNSVNYPLSPAGDGTYQSSYVIQNNDQLELHFMFDGKEVTGSTSIPSAPTGFTQSATTIAVPDMSSGPPSSGSFPDPVQITWDNPDTSYYLIVVENIESNPTPIRDTADGRPEMIFRNQPTTSNIYDIQPMSFQYYGTHRIILYHLNPDYAYLYSDNNASSQNLTTPQSDITNGLGIFTGINADTLLLEVTQ